MDATEGGYHAWNLRRPTAKTQVWIYSLNTVHESDPGRVALPTARKENSHTRMHLLEGILRVVLLDDVHVGDLITRTEVAVGTPGASGRRRSGRSFECSTLAQSRTGQGSS